MMKSDKNKYIEDLKSRHPRLDFSKFEYKNRTTKSIVICPIHGEIENNYNNLIVSTNGCLKCSNVNKITPEEAISNMKTKFPQFDYSKFVYKGRYEKSTIICPKHGEFQANYKNFFNHHVHGCKKCARELVNDMQRNDLEEVMSSLNKKYPKLDFSKFEYKNRKTKSIVICPEHGEFEISYAELIADRVKYACPTCGRLISDNNRLLGRDYMVEKLSKKYPNYDFSKFNPRKTIDYSTIICHTHGEFESTFDYMMLKNLVNACPKCHNIGYSQAEKEIVSFIKTFYDKKIVENNRSIIKNEYTNKFLELDIYLPDINLAIEFNGIYYHSDEMIKENKIGFNSAEEYHKYKSSKCKEQNIHLIHINEQEWLSDKSIVLNNIKNKIINKYIL